MRILVLNYELPPVGGGGGMAAKQLSQGFVEQGHQVDYVTSYHPELQKKETIDGINVHRVRVGRRNKRSASAHSMLLYPITGAVYCMYLCLKREYDLINTHFAIPTGPVGFLISSLFDIPNILSLHGADIHDPTRTSPHEKWYFKKTVELVINNADYVVAQSSDTKENTNNFYSISKDISIIQLPYEQHEFESVSREYLGLNPKKLYLVSIGRLVKKKGFDILIEAFGTLNNNNVELLIIGDGPKKEELRQLSIKLDVSDRVHFLGYVPEDEKFQYLSNSDIYVLPSRHEPFGIVLQEAMQVGLPIVATDNGGHTDFIRHNENGFLFSSNDSDSLKNSIKRMINSNKKRFSEKNKMDIKKFDKKKISKNYIGLMFEI